MRCRLSGFVRTFLGCSRHTPYATVQEAAVVPAAAAPPPPNAYYMIQTYTTETRRGDREGPALETLVLTRFGANAVVALGDDLTPLWQDTGPRRRKADIHRCRMHD